MLNLSETESNEKHSLVQAGQQILSNLTSVIKPQLSPLVHRIAMTEQQCGYPLPELYNKHCVNNYALP